VTVVSPELAPPIRPILIALLLGGCGGDAPRAERVATADSAQVGARDSVVTMVRTATGNGELTVENVRFTESGVWTHTIRVDGRVLREEEFASASVDRVWERPAFAPDASVVLIQVEPGGNACMWRYHLALLRAGRPAAITDAFGTCADPDSVWVAGRALRMRFPAFITPSMNRDGIDPGPPTTWMYREGRLREEEG
jgi:hypothetical protein